LPASDFSCAAPLAKNQSEFQTFALTVADTPADNVQGAWEST
jgi:hypothetical protein